MTRKQQYERVEQLTQLISQAQEALKTQGTTPPSELSAWVIEREIRIQKLITEEGVTNDLTGQEEELAENSPEQQATPQEIALKLANSVYAQIDPTPATDLELARIYAELALTQAINELTQTWAQAMKPQTPTPTLGKRETHPSATPPEALKKLIPKPKS